MDSPTNDGTCDAHPVTDEPFIDVRETHTAVVVLAGDRAFKAKKPVVTDFCDFRTAEQRERACIREFELNSRLARRATWALPISAIQAAGTPNRSSSCGVTATSSGWRRW